MPVENINRIDLSKIATDDTFQMRYLQERLGVTREQLREAIETVGNDLREVVPYVSKLKRAARDN